MKMTTFFVRIFNISPCVFTHIPRGRARRMSSSHFLGISCFLGSVVCQKYAMWVLVGCGIKSHIQWAIPLEILVKT